MTTLRKMIVIGWTMAAGLGGLNVTGCTTGLDEACVMTATCGDDVFQAVQNVALKQVAIY